MKDAATKSRIVAGALHPAAIRAFTFATAMLLFCGGKPLDMIDSMNAEADRVQELVVDTTKSAQLFIMDGSSKEDSEKILKGYGFSIAGTNQIPLLGKEKRKFDYSIMYVATRNRQIVTWREYLVELDIINGKVAAVHSIVKGGSI